VGEEEKARAELESLKQEHQDLEDDIDRITESPVYDQLMVQRIKRKKLLIKDRIAELREFLCEDIIA
jgi:hypothetical protein